MLNTPLQAAIAACADVAHPAQLHVVQVSSSGATGAVILHGWLRGESHARVVVKTPRDARLQHALAREWHTVRELRHDPVLAGLVPAALDTFRVDGATYFAYAGAPGRTMYSRFRNRLLPRRRACLEQLARQACGALAQVHASASEAADAQEIAGDLLADLAWLERTVAVLPPAVASTARIMAGRIGSAARGLPMGRVHGDFSPYNVITDGTSRRASLSLIDWEHSEPRRPQHLDVFRFVCAGLLMGRREQSRVEALRSVLSRDAAAACTLLRPWLQALDVADAEAWTRTPSLEALWWHYMIHAARREQERRAMPQDWSDSTYLPALAGCAAHGEIASPFAAGACAAT